MQRAKILRKIAPACAYCRLGISCGDVVLCGSKGIVDKNFKCRRFRYDPIKRVPDVPAPLLKYSPDDFSID